MPSLTENDLRTFQRDGYLVLPGVVPEPLLAAADAEIDRVVAGGSPLEGDGGPGVNAWFLPRGELPRCEALFERSPLRARASELVAPNDIEIGFDQVQISTTRVPWSHIPGGPHIDGHGPDLDAPYSFTMLAGVLLTDQTGDQSGNLWVWPGSHLVHRQLFHERGTRALFEVSGHSTLLTPPVTLDAPTPVRGERGDVVLAHFLLGHNKGGHASGPDRRTVYFRLMVPGHAERWDATFLDPWLEYPSLQPFVGAG